MGWEIWKNPWLVGLEGGDMVESEREAEAEADVAKTGGGDDSLGDGFGVRYVGVFPRFLAAGILPLVVDR